MLRISSFVLILCSLVACGGGGGGGTTAVSTPSTSTPTPSVPNTPSTSIPSTPAPTTSLVFPSRVANNPHYYRWTQVSPKSSGAWSHLAIDPNNSNIRYVATNANTGGVEATTLSALSKSIDAGKTWVRSDVGIQAYTIFDYARTSTYKQIYTIIVHPTDSNIIYAGSLGHGIYVSNDAGNSWQSYTAGLSTTYDGYTLQALYLHPQDPERLFAFNHDNLVFSTNRGKNWQVLPVPEMTASPTGLVFEGDHPNIFYITSYSDGVVKLHRTDDTGKTWQTRTVKVNNQTLSDPYTRYVLGATLQNGKFKLLLGTSQGLFTSTDQGNTWQAPQANTPEAQSIVAIAAEGANVYISTTEAGQLYQLQPNGSWLQRNTGLPSMRVNYIKINPQQTREVYVSSTEQNTAFNSSDSGETWEWVAVDKSANSVLTGSQFSHVLYAHNQKMPFYSTDYGDTWSFLKRDFLADDTDISTMAVAQDRLYIYTNKEGRIYTSANKGDTWKESTKLALPLYPNYVANAYYFAISPYDPKQVYLNVIEHLFKSEDGGETWFQQETGLNHFVFDSSSVLNPEIAKVVFSPSTSYLLTKIFAGDFVGLQTALFMRTAQTWQRIAPSLIDAYDVFVGGEQGEILYALSAKTDLYVGAETYPLSISVRLLKSIDQGQTWQATGLTQTVSMYGAPSDYSPLLRVAVDPKDTKHLYAVFVNHYPSQTVSSTQILHSLDAGQTWTPISLLNEPITAQSDKVYTLGAVTVAHPSDGTTGTLLYINTNTGGYRLDLPF